MDSFLWGLLISVIILNSSSNPSRRFYLIFFHDVSWLLLVSNETANLTSFNVNIVLMWACLFMLFFFFNFWSCFSVWKSWKKKVLGPVLSSDHLPPTHNRSLMFISIKMLTKSIVSSDALALSLHIIQLAVHFCAKNLELFWESLPLRLTVLIRRCRESHGLKCQEILAISFVHVCT